MYLFRIFYSFLPLRNPIGFGSIDLIVLAIAILMVGLLVVKAWLTPHIQHLATRTRTCMVFLFASSVALRLALVPSFPAPIPSGADDFSYLLLADTLAHLRLATHVHVIYEFFEAVFVLQQPTYASIYPLGQGLVLAAGEWLGDPWIGVLVSGGMFCALCYWMLRGWVTPAWALCGGLLAMIQFGALNPWVNSYWGGYVSAMAGCLVFGALPRLSASLRSRDALALGLGLAMQLISRPFEAIFLFAVTAAYLTVCLRGRVSQSARPMIWTVAAVCGALVLTLAQDKAVTNDWLTTPYGLSRYEYGVPTTLTFQPNPIPHRQMTAEQALDYDAQSAIHGGEPDTVAKYFERLLSRLKFIRFFLLPPLFIAVVVFLVQIRGWRYVWVAGSIALFFLGTNFYPYFYPHYVAAVACLFVLVSVGGLEKLDAPVRSMILCLIFAAFLFWYGIYAAGDPRLLDLADYQSWNYVNPRDPQGRQTIENELANSSGQQLVFVHYSPYHRFQEWIHNDANIDMAKTVWANDLGRQQNERLLSYYPHRKAWLLTPDSQPPRLVEYPSANPSIPVGIAEPADARAR